jgi:hypothetical protein
MEAAASTKTLVTTYVTTRNRNRNHNLNSTNICVGIHRVSQKLLCSKVPRITLQFFLQMLEMSPAGLKTCLDTLLHCATGVLCCCRFQCYTPTAATYRRSRLPYIPVHSNFWDTLYITIHKNISSMTRVEYSITHEFLKSVFPERKR